MVKVIVLLALVSVLYTEKIAKVEFLGLKNVKISQVKDKVKLRKGLKYSFEALQQDLKSLSELEYFEKVEGSFNDENMVLTFKFVERPVIKKIEFKGNKTIKDKKLREKIQVKKEDFLNDFKLKQDVESILKLYKEEGFEFTEVNYANTPPDEKNHTVLTFLIDEGKRYMLEDITISGARYLKPRKIISILKLKKRKPFRADLLEEGIERIKEIYVTNGYQKVEIKPVKISQNGSIKIVLEINEGRRYRLGEIRFLGNEVFSVKKLKRAIGLKTGEWYNEKKIEKAIQIIQELYGEKGYLRAFVSNPPSLTYHDEKAEIDIIFKITEGEIVYVNDIHIEGNAYTKKHVIRREIVLKGGEPLATTKIRKSVERLFNLGFLEDVAVDFLPTQSVNEMDVVFVVTEGKPGMLSGGAAYSYVDGLVGTFQLSHLNFLGLAQRLNLLLEFGARRQNYEVSWTDPYFLNQPFSLGISLFNITRIRDYNIPHYISNAYHETRRGFEVRIGPRLTEYLVVVLGYSFEFLKVFNVDDRLVGVLSEHSSVKSGFATQLIHDTRDNIFDPSRGVRNSIMYQISGGPFLGDVHFHKTTLRSSLFIPVIWGQVLSVNFVSGFMDKLFPWMPEEKLVPEKFAVGGVDTVRGYDYGEIGRGNIMLLHNIEYKIPLAKEKGRTILQGALFFDLGGSWNRFQDMNLSIGNRTDQLRTGVGFGLRFVLPYFPIRFDFGYPLNPSPGRPQILQFYFTLGQMF